MKRYRVSYLDEYDVPYQFVFEGEHIEVFEKYFTGFIVSIKELEE